MSSTRLFVGSLTNNTTEEDLSDLFRKYGTVSKIELRNNYAFVIYENDQDAQEAIRSLHEYELDGSAMKVEEARTSSHYNRERENMKKVVKRYDLRVSVSGLESRVSWQDLKDWARKAGDVTFTNIYIKDGQHFGVIEFQDEEGMEAALRILEDVPLKGLNLRLEKDDSNTDYQPVHAMSSRPPHHQASRGREFTDGPGSNYGRGGNYDNIRGGGGDNYRGGDRGGGNFDRPPPSYMNERGGGNYGGPAIQHGGYDSGPYHRNAPAGGNYGGPRGGGYNNYDGPRGGNRPPMRDMPPHSGSGGPQSDYYQRNERDRSRSRDRVQQPYRDESRFIEPPMHRGGPPLGGDFDRNGTQGGGGPRGGYIDRGPSGPRGGYDRGGMDGPPVGFDRGGPPPMGGNTGGRYYERNVPPSRGSGYDSRGPR